MTESRKQRRLHTVASPKAKPAGPSLSLVKRALRMWSGRGISKAVRRANALKWLAANAVLGERHLLKGGAHRWGQPGEPGAGVAQVYAPRRLSK